MQEEIEEKEVKEEYQKSKAEGRQPTCPYATHH
jgi:hypothetical protein